MVVRSEHVHPLKDKTSTSIKAAFKYLFRVRKPISVQSDKGTEFLNTIVLRYLKIQDVNFHTTHNLDIKGAIIERLREL